MESWSGGYWQPDAKLFRYKHRHEATRYLERTAVEMGRVLKVVLLCLLLAQSGTLCSALIQGSRTLRSITRLSSTGTSSAQNKLYSDMQAAKNRRAETEETLLLPGIELQEETFKVPTASGSGFGAVTSVKAKATQLATALRDKGVIRLNKCLTRPTARALRLLILEEMESARRLMTSGEIDPFSVMGMEPERKSRTDFKLSLTRRETPQADQGEQAKGAEKLCHPVADALYELFGLGGTLTALYDILAGANGEGLLYDLGAMTTFPGSPRQPIHTDFPFQKEAPIYSVYVALQDVTAQMGPTVFLPRTNNARDHNEWKKGSSTFDAYLQKKTPNFALLQKGDLIVYDPLVLHCGAANLPTSGSSRSLFNVGFLNPKVSGDFGYSGSMRPGYKGVMSYEQMKQRLQGYKMGGVADPFAKYGDGL